MAYEDGAPGSSSGVQNKEPIDLLDVAGTFDNCFFHCLATHTLATKGKFPEDLFNFKSILGANSPASTLQTAFPNVASLDLFSTYAKLEDPKNNVPKHAYTFEKTLVLGVLLREWFATKIATPEAKAALKENARDIFRVCLENKEIYGEMFEDAMSGNYGVIFEANKMFFQDKTLDDFDQYWDDIGAENYAQAFANPNTKLSRDELERLKDLGLSFSNFEFFNGEVFNPDHSIASLSLSGSEGHYKLQKKGNMEVLNAYEASNQIYKAHREALLSQPSSPQSVDEPLDMENMSEEEQMEWVIAQSQSEQSSPASSSSTDSSLSLRDITYISGAPLIAAIFPSALVTSDLTPMDAMIEQIHNMQERVNSAFENTEQQEREQQEREQQEKEQQEKIKEKIQEKQPVFNDYLKKLENQLNNIDEKHKEAKKEAKNLVKDLKKSGKTFFADPTADNALQNFINGCNTAVTNNSNELKKHRGFGSLNSFVRGFLGVLSILLAGIMAIVVHKKSSQGALPTFFGTPKTRTEVALDEFNNNINDLKDNINKEANAPNSNNANNP